MPRGRKLRARPNRRQRESPRPTAHRRGYDRRWRQASRAFLSLPENHLCRECRRRGRETAAECVDHITPHRGDRRLFWDRTNWQPLCHPCHSVKTATEDGGFGHARKVRPADDYASNQEQHHDAARPRNTPPNGSTTSRH